jgi:membrane-associated phospholipid phosphatase
MRGIDVSDFPGRLNLGFLFAAILIDIGLAVYLDARIVLWSMAPSLAMAGMALAVAWYLKVRSDALNFPEGLRLRLDTALKGVAFILVCLLTLRIYNHLTMNIVLPLADGLLYSWDISLGLGWMPYFHFVRETTILKEILRLAYVSFDAACFLGFLALVAMGRLLRARYFCEVFLITSLVSISVGFLLPAEGSVAYHFGHLDSMPGFAELPGLYAIEHFYALRGSAAPEINLLSMPGLVTFPSFHTAGGILLIAGFFRTRLFWLALPYSAVMIASTPVFGGHYFVDLIAGIALAAVVCAAVARSSPYRDLFAPPARWSSGLRLPEPVVAGES